MGSKVCSKVCSNSGLKRWFCSKVSPNGVKGVFERCERCVTNGLNADFEGCGRSRNQRPDRFATVLALSASASGCLGCSLSCVLGAGAGAVLVRC